jgi:hypothetical protein
MDCGSSVAEKTSRQRRESAAYIAIIGGLSKGVSDRPSQVEERSGPPEVTEGEAFTLGSHETLAGWKVVGYYEDDSRILSSAEAHGRFILDQGPAAAAQSDGPQLTATNQPPHELSR